MKVKIASGWSAEGGSTFSLMELCDLFNERGLDCTFYGPHTWHLDKCSKADMLQNIKINPDDVLIFHFMDMPQRPACRRVILSCHEWTSVFDVNKRNISGADAIRYVSQRQKDIQGVNGKVIPNLVRGITKSKNTEEGVAGIIGTVNTIKAPHKSIKRALADGCKKVRIYGNMGDINYFNTKVKPLLSDDVTYMGMEVDRQKIYDSVSCVYQDTTSKVPETFGRVRAECIRANIPYHGNDNSITQFELWEEDRVFDEFMEMMK